jgi:transposase
MQRYIGLDVHAASSTLAVISQAGKRLQTAVVETNGRALVEAIRMIPGQKHLCFEEGTQSAWLYEILSPHVEEAVVAGVTKKQRQKSDKIDAWNLADKLRTGRLEKQIFKAPRQFGMLRELARTHMAIARDLVRVQARLKSVYRSRGIRTPGRAVYGRAKRDSWQQQLPANSCKTAKRLYEQLDFLVDLKAQAEQDLVRESRKQPITRLLETVPGMGPIRVARLVPIVVTPYRFRTRQQFWSYCGLGIVMRTSSDWVRTDDGGWIRSQVQQTRGLTRQHNHVLKDIFKGAATTVVVLALEDPIYSDYQRLLEAGTKPNLAKLTLARKIAATVLAMWKKEERYTPQKVRASRDADREA